MLFVVLCGGGGVSRREDDDDMPTDIDCRSSDDASMVAQTVIQIRESVISIIIIIIIYYVPLYDLNVACSLSCCGFISTEEHR
jgi:hypothetical protein